MKVLYYFRNDLRLRDNPLLEEACSTATAITFVAKAPGQDWGVWRQKFHWECLEDLRDSLKQYGHDLAILNDPLKEISLQKYERLYTPLINTAYERREIEEVSNDIEVRTFWCDRLLTALPYQASELSDIFTTFRKAIEKDFRVRPLVAIAERWPEVIDLPLKSLETPNFPEPHPNSAFAFIGGERQASKRLEHYTFGSKAIETYKETRNGLVGSEYSTKLSAYLALGCLSPHQVWHQVDLYESQVKKNQDTYWVKFELWWREYFRWVHEKYQNKLFKETGFKEKKIEAIENHEIFESWKKGKTPDDFVNANMIELKETGFMSNRGRQNVASYLVKDLKLPWMWGAQHFESELIDYDVFSNWGNWQYVAGVGNDPRPNRYFNTQKQAGMYDPQKTFRGLWLT